MEPDPATCPFGPQLQPYWDMRLDLFSRFDEGIQIDAQGLYSTKPEGIAMGIGRALPGSTVFDAFCGVGGTSIGFARAGKNVIAVDLNQERLAMAAHNASLYGVQDRITFVHGDMRDVIGDHKFDTVFLDPPWGGPSYKNQAQVKVSEFDPNGIEVLQLAFQFTDDVAIGAPKNFDENEFAELGRRYFVQPEFRRDRYLFSTVYFGQEPNVQGV